MYGWRFTLLLRTVYVTALQHARNMDCLLTALPFWLPLILLCKRTKKLLWPEFWGTLALCFYLGLSSTEHVFQNYPIIIFIEGCEKKLQNLVCNHIDVKLIHAKTRGLKNDSRNNFSVDNK